MITTFQATGASAGTAKCSNEFSIPTSQARKRQQHDDREHDLREVDGQVLSAGSSSKPGANRLITGSATA